MELSEIGASNIGETDPFRVLIMTKPVAGPRDWVDGTRGRLGICHCHRLLSVESVHHWVLCRRHEAS